MHTRTGLFCDDMEVVGEYSSLLLPHILYMYAQNSIDSTKLLTISVNYEVPKYLALRRDEG